MRVTYMSETVTDISNSDLSSRQLAEMHILTDPVRDVIDRALAFSKAQMESALVCVTIPFENIDPLAVLETLSGDNEFGFYWEHPADELAMAGSGVAVRIRSNQNNRFKHIENQITHWKTRSFSWCSFPHTLAGVHFLGGFSYLDQPQTHHWKMMGSASFTVPRWLMIREGKLNLLSITEQVGSEDAAESVGLQLVSKLEEIIEAIKTLDGSVLPPPANPASGIATNNPNAKSRWFEGVSRAKSYIARQIFEKIVLAREVIVPVRQNLRATCMVNYLRNNYPTCYTFMYRTGNGPAFMGSTPERLASFRSSFVLTDGLAGTVSRGKTATEDTILEKKLMQSSKDLAEHHYVVKAITERLQQLTSDIQIPEHPMVRKYQNVQHLYTPITADMNENVSAFGILDTLHPTPAVGGFPMDDTAPFMQELEQFDRGWYAGPLGWMNQNGRGEFNVAIRSGLIEKNQVRLFAGCGIVAASDEEQEWDETNLKLIPMLSALKHG